VSGHVFHPGHSALHGITVVLDTRQGSTYVGRFHEETPRGMLLHDAAGFDPAAGGTRDEFLRRTAKYGVRIDHRSIVVPSAEVAGLAPFGDLKL
jgi:hypothetical protein